MPKPSCFDVRGVTIPCRAVMLQARALARPQLGKELPARQTPDPADTKGAEIRDRSEILRFREVPPKVLSARWSCGRTPTEVPRLDATDTAVWQTPPTSTAISVLFSDGSKVETPRLGVTERTIPRYPPSFRISSAARLFSVSSLDSDARCACSKACRARPSWWWRMARLRWLAVSSGWIATARE